LLAVNIVVVKDAAAKIPQKIPLQSNFKLNSYNFVARKVPKSTIITETIFCVDGSFYLKTILIKHPSKQFALITL